MSDHKIDKQNVEDILGLTAMQEGMLFHYLANPGSRQYFEQIQLRLSGSLDSQRLEQAWQVVTQTNEMLRSVIRWEKLDDPLQIIFKEKKIPFRVKDFSREKKEDLPLLLDKIKEDDKNEAINLAGEPLRVTLCLLNEREAEMLITFHHIIYDGWSTGIILKEFVRVYDALCRGQAAPVIQKTKYKEFFKWYRQQDEQKQDEFWKDYLDGFDTRTLLPYDKGKKEDIRYVSTRKINISQNLEQGIEECMQAHNVTLAAFMFAAWGILLQRYNNSGDVVFGTTAAGRPPVVKGIDNMVGMFINTLPVRFNAAGAQTLSDVFSSISRHLKERNHYEHTSLTRIKQFSGIGKDSNLFDSIIVIDNYPLEGIEPRENLALTSYDLFEMTSFDLTLQILPSHTLEICFHYNRGLFEAETIQRLTRHFQDILQEVTEDPAKKVSDIRMIAQEEKEQILFQFNRPDITYLGDKTIHGIIRDQAEKTPDNIALIGTVQGAGRKTPAGDALRPALTYRVFEEAADRLAVRLQQSGVARGSRVALMFPRSIRMIIGVIGILKAGAACIPLDITYPHERNSFIIEDSGAKFLLKHPSVAFEHSADAAEILYNEEKINTHETVKPQNSVQPDDLSYIIYTSGSTGNPKGALLNHWGIVNHTYTKIGVLEMTGADIVGNNFSINVIASIWQILSPLFTGAKLVLYSDEIEWDPYQQFWWAAADGVTVIEVIPPVLKAFLFLLDEGKPPVNLDALRKIALTSEETKPFLVNAFYQRYKHTQLVDCYGQTECSDDVLHYTIPCHTRTQKVPIGTPSLNTQVLILSRHDQLQPVGVVGEICVSGAGVGEGYWNRPQLNREKFAANPLIPGIKMYRTGDLGRWLPDGKVEFLGRIDHQVKIRGNRVELREIENHVIGFEAVKEAAVIAGEDKEGEKSLYAFFVSQREITASEIRQYLLKTLPDYMVPAQFIRMEKLPVTPNGKLDRKALARVEVKDSIASGAQYKPPRSEFEQKIETIWRQLLDKEKIGIDDNFFDLGGHSLLLIKLKSRLEKIFDREVSVIELFNYPTIGHQARYFEGTFSAGEKREKAVERRSDNRDIAVIGISLRVPGARDIDEFWKNIINGVESISFFEKDQLEGSKVDQYIQGNSKLVPAGGILGDIDRFDADFFGFSPREAEIIDPQQRLFIEHAWMALEDAGYVGETFPGRIGVYGGVGMNTYLLNNVMGNPKVVNTLGEFQTMIGNDKDFLATRVSYKLNLSGPALTIQTACSTSLVAVHLARQGLLSHECDMALAGGAAVHVPEKSGYFYNEGGYLSPDGHCRAFDADADGTVFSNGIGIVLLKPLEAAVDHNDHIYAVIKGSAINNDGSFKVGYTSPSEIGQSRVISDALADAGLHPESIRCIETHGTGTVLGDPVEMAALTRAYRAYTQENQYCAVGSLKSNLGHMDTAAGVVGLIKAVLCLKHKQIPPSINVERPNPMIDFPNTPFYVSQNAENWDSDGTPRRAGVNSFGIGGTNAHVILEEWCKADPAWSPNSPNHQLLLLSARTENALHQVKDNLLAYLKNNPVHPVNPKNPVQNVFYTLAVGRKAFDHRLALVCRDRDDAIKTLEEFNPKRILMHTRQPGEKSVVFMFSGIGEHYVNMTSQLYKEEPVFRREVDQCCDLLKPILDRDLRDILYVEKTEKKGEGIDFRKLVGRDREEEPLSEEEKVLSQTIYSQTSVFVVEYALARLLMSWGIIPYAMIGYSTGEYAAACISGVFSLEDALFLVANRAQLIHSVEKGAMLAVSLPEKELEPLLASLPGVSLAAKNTPDLCIVSGKPEGIAGLEKQLKERKAVYRRLKSFQAFHSRMMEAVRPQLTALFEKVTINLPTIPYLSNVTGTWVTNEEVVTPGYWVRHTESSIRFSDGIGELLNTPCHFFLEIGPGNSLCGFTAQHPHVKSETAVDRFVLASLPKESEKVSDKAFLLRTLGKLWIAGMEIDWTSFYKPQAHLLKRVPLPTYPFERKRYWLEPETETAKYVKDTKERIGLVTKEENIDEWFYVPCWKQSVPPPAAPGSGNWLVFQDESPVGGRFIRQLKLKETDSTTITIVRRGEGFEKIDEGVYTIRPGEYDDYAALLEDLQAGGRGFDTIVHLWLLSPSPVVPDFLERGVYSLLHLVRAMGRLSMFDSLELWVVGNHLHKIESSDMCSPGKAAVLGPCNVITQEYPNILCRSIDIGLYLYTYAHAPADTGGRYDEETAAVVDTLLTELTSSPADRVIAYRGNTRWVQTFEPISPPAIMDSGDIPGRLREKGVYLITGGLGKIGLTIARYLARTLRAKLVLTSRSGLHKPGQEQAKADPRLMRIRQLEEMDAEVLVVQADAADKKQMEQAVHLAEERFGTIHGVLHAAGVMDESAFKLISDLEPAGCEPHFKPKIQGTIVLEEVFRDRELDFCLLSSSLSPLLGGLSLYAYSAANAFMDAFARQQALVNRKHWISINWADWQREEEENTPASANLGTTVMALNITAEEGKETFRRVLAFHKLPQIVVSSGDLHRRLQQWVLTHPGKEETGAGSDGDRNQPVVHQRPRLQSIFEAPKNEPEKIVAEIWQELLGIDCVGVHDNFFELGGHSLIATKLISRLREIFRIDIPLPTLFNKPTIQELVGTIVHSWGDSKIVEEIADTYREVQMMT